MTVGGYDYVFRSAADADVVGIVEKIARARWPNLLLQDAGFDASRSSPSIERELFVTRDAAAVALWEELGADPQTDGTLLYAILEYSEKGFRKIGLTCTRPEVEDGVLAREVGDALQATAEARLWKSLETPDPELQFKLPDAGRFHESLFAVLEKRWWACFLKEFGQQIATPLRQPHGGFVHPNSKRFAVLNSAAPMAIFKAKRDPSWAGVSLVADIDASSGKVCVATNAPRATFVKFIEYAVEHHGSGRRRLPRDGASAFGAAMGVAGATP